MIAVAGGHGATLDSTGGGGLSSGGSGSNGGGAGRGGVPARRNDAATYGNGGGGGWAGGGGAAVYGAGGGGYGGGGGGGDVGGGSDGTAGGSAAWDAGAGGNASEGEDTTVPPNPPVVVGRGGGGGYAVLGGIWVGGGGGTASISWYPMNTTSTDGGAAAGIYNAAGAQLTFFGAGCAIPDNLAAGGGGAGFQSGGQAVGGLWNAGALFASAACQAAISGNAARAGRNGQGTGPAAADNDLRGTATTIVDLGVSVTGGGSVTASAGPSPFSGAINACTSAGGAACAAAYMPILPAGVVTLTASAAPCQAFALQWGGACSGTANTCTVTMDQTRSVTAAFTLLYPITASANPAAGGSVACTPNPAPQGSTSTCSVTVNAGYAFTGWSGDCSGSGACSLANVTAPKNVTASFAPVTTTFSGTTVPPSGAGGPASAQFTGGGPACRFDLASTAFVAAPAAPPVGQLLPQGMFQFKLIGCDSTPVRMNITWPQPVSSLTKWGPASAGAQPSYFAPDGLSVSGNTSSFTVIDGQKGDDDWTVNGTIVDPVGPTQDATVAPVPTLGPWALALLGLLAAGLGVRRRRRV